MIDSKLDAGQEVQEAYLKLSIALRKAGKYEKAAAILHQAIREILDPASAYLALGLTFQESGKYVKASNAFRSAFAKASLEDKETRKTALFGLGSVFMKRTRLGPAIKAFQDAINEGYESSEIYYLLGTSHDKAGNSDKALEAFTNALRLNPEDSQALFERALILWDQDDYELAIKDLDRVLSLNPDNAKALALRGETHRFLGNLEPALNDLNNSLTLKSDNPWAKASRGATYKALGEYDKALADFNEAINEAPIDSFALANRGNTYLVMDRYEEALADLKAAIDINPGFRWALMKLGITLRELGRYEEALASFNKLLRSGNHYMARHNLARVYCDMGFYKKALSELDKALKLAPDNPFILADRGNVYRFLGDYDKGLLNLNRAIQIEGHDPTARVIRGEIFIQLKRYMDAINEFNRAVEDDPDSSWLHYDLAIAYKAMSRTTKARTNLSLAIEKAIKRKSEFPRDLRNLFNLGIYLLLSGDAERSRNLYEEALGGGPKNGLIRETLIDLEELLRLFPDLGHASTMRDLLKQHLLQEEKANMN